MTLHLSSKEPQDLVYEINAKITGASDYFKFESIIHLGPQRHDDTKIFNVWSHCFYNKNRKSSTRTITIMFDFKIVGESVNGFLKNKYLSVMHDEQDCQFKDVTLKIGGQSIKAHRSVLSAASDVFKTMLSVDMVEKETQVITIDHMEYSTIKSLIEFIYTGNFIV